MAHLDVDAAQTRCCPVLLRRALDAQVAVEDTSLLPPVAGANGGAQGSPALPCPLLEGLTLMVPLSSLEQEACQWQ